MHRSAVWKFSVRWIYYCANKSTRLKTNIPHLCAVPKSSSKSLLANLTKKPQFQNIHNSFLTFVLITTFFRRNKRNGLLRVSSNSIWRIENPKLVNQCTEVQFESFQSGGFTTVAWVNPPDWKLSNRTSVHWFTHFRFSICPNVVTWNP